MTDMIPETMKAMVTMGHGDFDMLVWHEAVSYTHLRAHET